MFVLLARSFALSHADGGFRGKMPTENAAVEAINWRAREKEEDREERESKFMCSDKHT